MTTLSEVYPSVARGEVEHVLLSSVARIVSGGTPKTGEASFWNGDIPWATPKDLSDLGSVEIHSTPRMITEAGLRNSSAEVLPENSVLFSSRAPIGLLAINTTPMATNQGFKSFVPDPERLDSRYLFRWLEANRANLQSMGVGATFKEVSKAIVSRLVLPLPPLDEQRGIAAVLDKADELRTKRRQALVHIDALIQSVFNAKFGDVVRNTRGWPLHTFEDVAPSRLGKMLDKSAQSGNHLRKYIRNANVQWFNVDTSDLAQMDFDEKSRSTFRLAYGDVLICEGGEPGRAAMWRAEIEDCYYQKAVHRARPNTTLVTSEYLVYLFWNLSKGGGFADHVTVATIAHLTGEKLKRMKISVPPLQLQKEFSAELAAAERLKEYHRAQLTELDALFASLQHRAFKGEL